MFHVKRPRSVEEAARTTRVKPRRNHRPRERVLLPEPVGAFLPSFATMRGCQSPSRVIRSLVNRCRLFHVKHRRGAIDSATRSLGTRTDRNEPTKRGNRVRKHVSRETLAPAVSAPPSTGGGRARARDCPTSTPPHIDRPRMNRGRRESRWTTSRRSGTRQDLRGPPHRSNSQREGNSPGI